MGRPEPSMNRKPLLLALLLLASVWTLGMVLVPYALPSGTVRGLDGHANVMDYWDRWEALPWYAAPLYAFGDLNCHQMETRSLVLHGNQLPVDARMTAMFIAANLGLLTVLALPTRPSARDEAAELLPRGWRRHVATPRRRLALLTGILLFGLVPTSVDVVVQFLTAYESTNGLRLATGTLLGFLGALWVGLVFDSLLATDRWPTLARRGPSPPVHP